MILFILKIIGILLLSLLLLFLFLLALVLFCPIYYDFLGNHETAKGRISFLFGIIRIRFLYQSGELSHHIKILWITLKDSENNKTERDAMKAPPQEDITFHKEDSSAPVDIYTKTEHSSDPEKNPEDEPQFQPEMIQDDIPRGKGRKKQSKNFDAHTKKQSMFSKAKNFYVFFRDYPNRPAIIECCKNLVIRLWKALRPSVCRVEGQIGFSDPAITGFIMGLISIINATLSNRIRLVGNFEKEVLQYDCKITGYFLIFSILTALARFFLAKPIWFIVKKWRKREDVYYGFQFE